MESWAKRQVWLVLVAAVLLLAACDGRLPSPLATPRPTAVPTTPTPAFPEPVKPVTAVTLTPLVDGLARPVTVAHAGDDRLFIAEQHGKIRVVKEGRLLERPFLDLGDLLAIDGSERGLLGLTFHPDYGRNGRFYVVYTNVDGDTDIVRYTVDPTDPDRADPASAYPLLHLDQPYGNHNGGQLLFGPDGMLYIALGDGGAVGDPFDNAQDTGTLLGALLRLDVDGALPYTIPPDNPFVGDPDARGELWAYGLRNPWSFTFDTLTGDLWIGDVGQEGPEELNFVAGGRAAGVNFGWPILEGDVCWDAATCDGGGTVWPVLTYPHDNRCAIVSGRVYRGTQHPDWAGNYFFTDYCLGTIWSLVYDGAGWVQTAVSETSAPVSAIAPDVNGELLVLQYRPGVLYRMTTGE